MEGYLFHGVAIRASVEKRVLKREAFDGAVTSKGLSEGPYPIITFRAEMFEDDDSGNAEVNMIYDIPE